MKKIIKILIFFIIVGIFAFFLFTKIKEKKKEIAKIPPPSPPIYKVKLYKLKKGTVEIKRNYLGVIEPDKDVNISSKFSGFIKKVYVSENDFVKKGQLLVDIDARDIKLQIKNLKAIKSSLYAQKISLEAQLRGALAKLDYFKNKYLRYKALYKEKAISKDSFELVKSNYLAQKAQAEALKSSISSINKKIISSESQIKLQKDRMKYFKIYSKINGIVTKVFLHEGNLAVPGKPILNIQTTKNYKIIINIPLTKAESIKKGLKAKILFPNREINSFVNKIYPSSNKNSLVSIELRINKLPPNIPTNSFVNVELVLKEISGFIVPNNAILSLTNGKYVLFKKNNKFIKIPIRIIAQDDNFSVISGNLKEGMELATGTNSKLRLISLGI